jgi:NTE family protein
VLRALREMKVPVDIMVGTSMGCVVGGAFAAGQSIEELEKMARTTDWDLVVADRPPRNQLTFRRREEDIALPTRIEFGVDRHGLTLPPSTAGNGALEQALMRLLPPGTHDLPANRLALPFRSVASDLLTGELVELSDVPLFMTIRASLSVPGVFAPVRVKGRLLVDGGLVRNLPVDFARARRGHRDRGKRRHAAGRGKRAREFVGCGAADDQHPDGAKRAEFVKRAAPSRYLNFAGPHGRDVFGF